MAAFPWPAVGAGETEGRSDHERWMAHAELMRLAIKAWYAELCRQADTKAARSHKPLLDLIEEEKARVLEMGGTIQASWAAAHLDKRQARRDRAAGEE